MKSSHSLDIPYTDVIRRKRRTTWLSPFARRYRQRRALQRLDPDISLAFHHAVTTPDGRFFYLKNSKVGCTTISQLLHTYAFGHAYDGNIHQSTDLPMGIRNWQHHRRALENPRAVKFTFVRHPMRRLRSAFFNFFVDCTNSQRHLHWDNMVAMGYSPEGNVSYNFDIFLDYVALNLAETERHCDQHWRPQWISIGSGTIGYDVIGRLETFDADMAEVFSRAELPDFLRRMGPVASHNRSSNGSRHDLWLTRAQTERIRTLYAVDYEAFNYD